MQIAPRLFRDVPEMNFRLKVKVDRTACGPPSSEIAERLNQLEKEGVEFTLLQIVTAATTLYSSSESGKEQDFQDTWGTLETWDYGISENRFIAKPPQNDMRQTTGTQALGMGVGVLIAEKLFALKLEFWERTNNNATFDYFGVRPDTGERIGLEARARLDRNNYRNNWQAAVDQAVEKLNKATPRDFATAVAVLFAPRSQPMQRETQTEDILIMDTENKDFTVSPSERENAALRTLLRHYAPFFIQQGGFPAKWGRRLLELADAEPEAFAKYLQHGDSQLQYDPRGLEKPWRTFFRYDGYRFCGSDFTGNRWPVQLNGVRPASKKGQFYWAIWEPIIEALRDGRLQEIAQMEVKSGETHSRGRVFVLQSDGIALAWAPNAETSNPGLFDDLFPDNANADAPESIPITHSKIRSA